MSIRYIEDTRQLILETKNTAYQMKIDELGYLQHLYYGPRLGQNDMSYPFRIYDHGFSGNPYDMRQNRAYSLDSMAQEYLIQCKLQKAITFLIETNNPIQEIARQVGYDNPLTFSKTFKNFYGVSPKTYRQQHREADMNSEKNPKELPV